MRNKPLVGVNLDGRAFDGEIFDLTPLLGRGELSPEKAKEAIMAAAHKLLRRAKISHGTFIAMDRAASPQEALLYVFRYMTWGTHDDEEYRQMLAADNEKRLQDEKVANEEMALYLQEDLRKMRAELDHAEVNDWTGDE